MAIFPNLGPEYFDEKDRGILSRMENFYQDSISINQSFWAEADIDTRFEAGDQTLWNELYGDRIIGNKKQFTYNRIRRIPNTVSGHQRKNRKSITVTPVENGDMETADQFTKILMWASDQEGILETLSESFHGALITGMNLLHVWNDFRSDPVSGNIKVDNCSYNSFLIDPFFRKKDLSDCNGIWKRSFLTKTECISLLPDDRDLISALSANGSQDGKFEFMPESTDYGSRKLLTYDEFYYRDYRSQRMLIDSQTGETFEWKSSDEDGLKAFLAQYPQITVVDQEIPTVKLAIVVQGKVVYNGQNTMGIDSYPFVPVFGYYNPQIQYFPLRIQGMVRGLRDAQFLYNRNKNILGDLWESQMSGIKYKEDALVNPKDAFLSGRGKGLALKSTAQMSDVEQMIAPGIPPTAAQLTEEYGKEMLEISGVNEELLGSAMDEKAGILAKLRQGAGLTTLQVLFDQLDYSQKLLGKLMIDIVQTNFTPGKVKRIIEDEPTQQFYNKAFGKYDAAVEEGLNTTTQRQMQFAQLLQLREAGIAIPDDVILEATTVQNKKSLLESIKASNEQKQQIEQMQIQAAIKEQEARTNLAEARAVADKGLGLERVSRIEENQELAVERRAEAQKDRTQGLLNLVKTLQEIDDLDIAQIEKLINLTNLMKAGDTDNVINKPKVENSKAVDTTPKSALDSLRS